jgi:hypothetical protein
MYHLSADKIVLLSWWILEVLQACRGKSFASSGHYDCFLGACSFANRISGVIVEVLEAYGIR